MFPVRSSGGAARSARRRVVTALVVVSVLVVGLGAGLPSPAVAVAPGEGLSASTRAELTQLARKAVDAGAPGVIVRVDDGRGHPFEVVEQAPWAAQDQRLQAGDEFRMGSNTKTMVATLVLQLVGEGRLALTDAVERWLPGRVPNGTAITLRMLLNHTSGLADYAADPALRLSVLGRDPRRWTNTDLLAVGTAHPPLFPPGTSWSYSNTDYVALGAVLERVTGASVADLVRDRIARPLHLEHTYLATSAAWRGRHVVGYEPDAAHMPPAVPAAFTDVAGRVRDGHVDVSGNDPSWGAAAGAAVSTAQDWSRFLTALMSGKILPAAQLAQMRTTVPLDPAQPDGPASGLGIETAPQPCGTVWAHDGGMPGYLSTNLTDDTGSRSASVLVPTELVAEFDADPQLGASTKALLSGAICAMFGKEVSAAR